MSTFWASLFPDLRLSFRKRIPLILQSEAAECGLACLAMVVNYYGKELNLYNLRERFSISLRGVNLKNIVDIANELSLTTRAIRVELNELVFLSRPCILHWNMNHFVVLKNVTSGADGKLKSITILDPAKGELVVLSDEISNSFTGIALELFPDGSFTKMKKTEEFRLRDLVGKIYGLRTGLMQIVALALALEIFALTAPFFMQWVVDGAVLSGDQSLLLVLGIGFSLLMIVQILIGFFRSWTVIYLSTHMNVQWVNNVFHHLLHLPLSYFEKRHAGDIASRFSAVHAIQNTLTTSFVEAILDGILGLSVLAVMFVYSQTLSAIVLLSIGVYVGLRILIYPHFRQENEAKISLQAKEQTLFYESLYAVQAIKLFNQENARRTRWLNIYAAAINKSVSIQKMTLYFNSVHSLIAGIENIIIIYFGALLVMNKTFSLGMLYAFLAYKTVFVGRIYSLIDKFLELRLLSIQAERLSDIVFAKTESVESFQDIADSNLIHSSHVISSSVIQPKLTIEIRNLCFRYSDSEPWVIDNLSLCIEHLESVALIGESGCGKTTLLKLLLGLLEPSSGEILVDGVPLNKFGVKRYRQMIGAVMQDDSLLSGSINDIISFFDQQFDSEKIVACAEKAHMLEDVLRMPMQFRTLIGDMGSSVSGGQKQRLLLARALYKNPAILFLDEATSHLDLQSERAINRTVSSLKLTRITVAHRPETIRNAERIVELCNGRIVKDISSSEYVKELKLDDRRAQAVASHI